MAFGIRGLLRGGRGDQAGELVQHTVGNALVLHAADKISPEAQNLALAVTADEENDIVVLDLGADLPTSSWESIAAVLPRRRRGIRLLATGQHRGKAALVGQWLSERLNRTVVAPDGVLVRGAAGALFVDSVSGSGWVQFRRGKLPVLVGKRYPSPPWDAAVAEMQASSATGEIEPLPGGVWIRPTIDLPTIARYRNRLVADIPCTDETMTVLVGCPGTPMLHIDDVIRFWRDLDPETRGRARFVQYGTVQLRPGLSFGQTLADSLETTVVCYSGVPVGSPQRYAIKAVRPDGGLGWEPFALELSFTPNRPGIEARRPTVVRHRPPIEGTEEIHDRVYWYAPDAVVEVVQAGLWVRSPKLPAGASTVRAAGVDAETAALFFDDSAAAARTQRMRELATDLAARLDIGARDFGVVIASSKATQFGRGRTAEQAEANRPAEKTPGWAGGQVNENATAKMRIIPGDGPINFVAADAPDPEPSTVQDELTGFRQLAEPEEFSAFASATAEHPIVRVVPAPSVAPAIPAVTDVPAILNVPGMNPPVPAATVDVPSAPAPAGEPESAGVPAAVDGPEAAGVPARAGEPEAVGVPAAVDGPEVVRTPATPAVSDEALAPAPTRVPDVAETPDPTATSGVPDVVETPGPAAATSGVLEMGGVSAPTADVFTRPAGPAVADAHGVLDLSGGPVATDSSDVQDLPGGSVVTDPPRESVVTDAPGPSELPRGSAVTDSNGVLTLSGAPASQDLPAAPVPPTAMPTALSGPVSATLPSSSRPTTVPGQAGADDAPASAEPAGALGKVPVADPAVLAGPTGDQPVAEPAVLAGPTGDQPVAEPAGPAGPTGDEPVVDPAGPAGSAGEESAADSAGPAGSARDDSAADRRGSAERGVPAQRGRADSLADVLAPARSGPDDAPAPPAPISAGRTGSLAEVPAPAPHERAGSLADLPAPDRIDFRSTTAELPVLTAPGPAAVTAAGGFALQPVPDAESSALIAPELGLDDEREWMRRTLSDAYAELAGPISRIVAEHPGLQGDQSVSAEDALMDTTAVRLFLGEHGPIVNAGLRSGVTGPHVPFGRCMLAGTSRLPSFRGATVYRASPAPGEWELYRARPAFKDWGFVTALAAPCLAQDGDTDVVIWSLTGRRTAVLEPEGAFHVQDRVLFAPGTGFKVLELREPAPGRRGAILLREVSVNEILDDGEVSSTRLSFDELALTSLHRSLDKWATVEPRRRIGTAAMDRFGLLPGLSQD